MNTLQPKPLMILLFLMIGGTLAVSCTALAPLSPSPSIAPIVSAQSTPSARPTQNPTYTPAPSSPTPTAILAAVISSMTPSITVPVPPTLQPVEVTAAVLALLKTNGNCTAPCFWGIIPGETTYEQATRFFQHLGRKEYIVTNEKDAAVYSYGFQIDVDGTYLNVRITLMLKAQLVNSIQVYLLNSGKVDAAVWEGYSLQHILATYGVPSEVVFFGTTSRNVPSGAEPQISFSHAVLYEPTNLAVFYGSGVYEDHGSFYRICPLMEDPTAGLVWFYLGENPYETLQTAVDFTDAVAVTLPDNELFYEMFLTDDENSCLDLNAAPFHPTETP